MTLGRASGSVRDRSGDALLARARPASPEYDRRSLGGAPAHEAAAPPS
ncbi:Hypothetical protein A7982_06909 [Minicystis rosea]|nr:Hypothetical protein A7982_06909 [Minicystis rosea]